MASLVAVLLGGALVINAAHGFDHGRPLKTRSLQEDAAPAVGVEFVASSGDGSTASSSVTDELVETLEEDDQVEGN